MEEKPAEINATCAGCGKAIGPDDSLCPDCFEELMTADAWQPADRSEEE